MRTNALLHLSMPLSTVDSHDYHRNNHFIITHTYPCDAPDERPAAM